MKTRVTGVWLFMCLMLFGFAGLANDTKLAKKAFDKGTALFEKEQYVDAAAQFRKAYDLRPNWKLLYNIGQCEAAARNYALALELFESYLVQGGDNIEMTRAEDLLIEIDRLKKLVGYLDIKGAPVGAEVIVNTDMRSKTPLLGPLAITASIENKVIIQKDEEILYDRSLKVHSGQTVTIDLSEKDAGVEQPVASEPGSPDTVNAPAASNTEAASAEDAKNSEPSVVDVSRYKRVKIAGWITFGTGAGALIASAVTGGIAYSKKVDLAPLCKGGCPDELLGEKEKMANLGRASDVLVISGAAVATTGLAILIVARVKEKKAKRNLAIAPFMNTGLAGFSIKGDF
ncbi:MAG: tetratricopeptide repeat protein [Deltaproteobacteria bacterium]|nr:tetratricopeptide repeat protein [Deltaproteobacteria bacterium]